MAKIAARQARGTSKLSSDLISTALSFAKAMDRQATFAWISRNRRVMRDFECYDTTVAAFVRLAMIRLMLKTLTKQALLMKTILLGSALNTNESFGIHVVSL